MTEYFTIKQLIEETDRDYFIVSVRVEFVNPETELEDYLITEVEIPFEDAANLEKKYDLSDDGVKELESDLSEYAEKDESEILDLAESVVLKNFPGAEILFSKIVQIALPDVIYEYLDELIEEE